MTDGGGEGISERELTCAICTEILYQPLTLLDCLHTFCGACLKEWFKWQAASASSSRRGTSNPYTCPSCRDSVRRTKADWRLNTLLEGFLKAHPDKVKSEEEKRELESHYKPGDDVLPPVSLVRSRGDREDERLLAQARDLSLSDRRGNGAVHSASRAAPRLTESTLRAHDSDQPHIEHQPSLRSLLSSSDENSQDVEAEILRSIYTEGLLDGIDLDNLTAEQEEELTEKIAEAYRRRHRHTQRSGNRERQQRRDSRSPRSSTAGAERGHAQTTQPSAQHDTGNTEQQQTRSRPPVSRPHLFEQTLETPARTQRRSRSSISQRSGHSDTIGNATPPGTRSATDLSRPPDTTSSPRTRNSRATSTTRGVTEPQPGVASNEIRQVRHSNTAPQETYAARSNASDRPAPLVIRRPPPTDNDTTVTTSPRIAPSFGLNASHSVRHAHSHSAFAPEAVDIDTRESMIPSINCSRCSRPSIQHDLHYNCRWCLDGAFNLCINCYRNGAGCNHWFGFGYRALERYHRTAPPEGWPIGHDRPHVLSARKYLQLSPQISNPSDTLQEGAFCDTCLNPSDDGYWHCPICLEGAWGFCDACVKSGHHCSHHLTVVAHLNSLQGGQVDPAKMAFVPLPHLRQDSYVNLPLDTGCDVCHRGIAPESARYHCYACNDGDFDVCDDCYRGLVARGQISQSNGPNGWRRCPQGHRMAIVEFQSTPEGGHVRITRREPVGGWSLREGAHTSNTPTSTLPPDGGSGMKCLALYSYFPEEQGEDDLAFPKFAEIREVVRQNEDWFVGVYAGRRGLFPAGYVRVL